MRLAWMLFFLLQAVNAIAAGPFAKAAIDGDAKIVPGQQIYVTVDVFVPDFFTSPPQFPLFEMPDALVTLPDERGQNLAQTIEGVPYSGIRRRYAIVPEAAGEYTLPPIEIDFGYSVDGKAVGGVVRTAAVPFVVVGDRNTMTRFAARNVTVEQAFDPNPAALKTGDALVRTITVTGEDIQAIMIPPVAAGVASGLAQYAKPAKIEDGIAVDRKTVSRRIETLIYTAAADGHFMLPAVEYPWLDLETGETDVAELPATEVLVAAAPAKAGIRPDVTPDRTPTPFEQRRHLALVIAILLAIAAGLWAGRRVPRAVAEYTAGALKRMRLSRAAQLRNLLKTIRTARPEEVHAALHKWSRREGFRTLLQWAESGPAGLATEIGGMETVLYSGHKSTFDRQRMARLVASAARTKPSRRSRSALPELNPGPERKRT